VIASCSISTIKIYSREQRRQCHARASRRMNKVDPSTYIYELGRERIRKTHVMAIYTITRNILKRVVDIWKRLTWHVDRMPKL
jgi:hypothetical protein